MDLVSARSSLFDVAASIAEEENTVAPAFARACVDDLTKLAAARLSLTSALGDGGSHYEGEALDISAEAANGKPGDVAAKAKAQRFAASAVKTEEETAEKALLQAAREEEKAKVSQLVANLMRLAP